MIFATFTGATELTEPRDNPFHGWCKIYILNNFFLSLSAFISRLESLLSLWVFIFKPFERKTSGQSKNIKKYSHSQSQLEEVDLHILWVNKFTKKITRRDGVVERKKTMSSSINYLTIGYQNKIKRRLLCCPSIRMYVSRLPTGESINGLASQTYKATRQSVECFKTGLLDFFLLISNGCWHGSLDH